MSNDSSNSEQSKGLRTKPGTDEPSPTRLAPSAPKVPWSPWLAVVYAVVVYFVAQVAASIIIVLYPHYKGWNSPRTTMWLNNSVLSQFLYVLLAEALTFSAIWWFIRRRGAGLRAIGWRRPRWMDPVFALSGFAVYFMVYGLFYTLAKHFLPHLNVTQKQDLGFTSVTGHGDLLLTFLSLVVLPPLVEETVFRGFVYTGLKNKLRPLWAGLATSLLFAMAHLEFGSGKPLLWIAAIDTFTLSLVLCYLREKTNSLWPGIVLHGLKNALAFVSLYVITLR
ncbi:MAG TPA: type II CAAX endopeptidase family protein [Candidatus Saccharimonadales bacterium]|nr:type II CAAX endopeptidase family protein [Candidatus Saccharimonadales bacterium]